MTGALAAAEADATARPYDDSESDEGVNASAASGSTEHPAKRLRISAMERIMRDKSFSYQRWKAWKFAGRIANMELKRRSILFGAQQIREGADKMVERLNRYDACLNMQEPRRKSRGEQNAQDRVSSRREYETLSVKERWKASGAERK